MKTHQRQTFLNCPYHVAGTVLIILGILFLIIGCQALKEATPPALQTLGQKLSEGSTPQEAAAAAASIFIWKLTTILAASAGTILSGLLAKWLNTEKKITKAIITGVENAEDTTVKKSIQSEALAAGVESILHSRVKQLT